MDVNINLHIFLNQPKHSRERPLYFSVDCTFIEWFTISGKPSFDLMLSCPQQNWALALNLVVQRLPCIIMSCILVLFRHVSLHYYIMLCMMLLTIELWGIVMNSLLARCNHTVQQVVTWPQANFLFHVKLVPHRHRKTEGCDARVIYVVIPPLEDHLSCGSTTTVLQPLLHTTCKKLKQNCATCMWSSIKVSAAMHNAHVI